MSTPRNDDHESLRGRVVLITGSGHGIGAELARAAGQRGARVAVNCRQNAKQAPTEDRKASDKPLVSGCGTTPTPSPRVQTSMACSIGISVG